MARRGDAKPSARDREFQWVLGLIKGVTGGLDFVGKRRDGSFKSMVVLNNIFRVFHWDIEFPVAW